MSAHPWIDVSVPIRTGMVTWPGDPAVEVRADPPEGPDDAQVSRLRFGSHTGTHVDAPLHFCRDGRGVDELPLDVAIGPAQVVAIDGDAIDEAAVAGLGAPGARILFRTRNSAAWKTGRFEPRFVGLTLGAAARLADARVALVGVDYLSIASPDASAAAVHRALLERGVWILEGLDLSAIDPGEHELVCLPLRLEGADGAPARAVLRRRG